jgi:hypothetical protein
VYDHGFETQSGQTKDYNIGICCFSAKHAALRLELEQRRDELHIPIKKHIRFMGSMWNLFANQSLKDSQNSFDTGHSHM